MTTTKASGTVWAILGHRFAIEGADGRILAGLGPKGAGGIALRVGDAVIVEGERKPAETDGQAIRLHVDHDGTIRTVKPARAEAA